MAEVQNKNGSHKNVLNLILARTLSFNVITSTKMLDGKILYLGKHNFANGPQMTQQLLFQQCHPCFIQINHKLPPKVLVDLVVYENVTIQHPRQSW